MQNWWPSVVKPINWTFKNFRTLAFPRLDVLSAVLSAVALAKVEGIAEVEALSEAG